MARKSAGKGGNMRLLCPNCGAQYEVDSSMIPDEGRDVQCSNCGKTWFQEPEEIDLGLSAPPRAAAEPEPEPAPEPEPPAPEPDPEETPRARAAAEFREAAADEPESAPEAPEPEPAPRAVDESVMGILREEAERELSARRAEGLETQTEMGLSEAGDEDTQKGALRNRMALQRAAEKADETASGADTSRSGLLPDIEEINSSLAPAEGDTPAPPPVDPAIAEARNRSGFRIGFTIMMLLAILLVAAYAYAPTIARSVPAAAPLIIVYVDLANSARAGIDGAMARSAESLSGLIGDTTE